MVYPEDHFKSNWDTIVSITLLIMCISTPIYIAFQDDSSNDSSDSFDWFTFNLVLDLIFSLDILIVFCTASYDEDFQLVDNRCTIAANYIRGWFFIDLLAIFPFEAIIRQSSDDADSSQQQFNDMIRITKLGRIYKLIKLTRLLRILKILK